MKFRALEFKENPISDKRMPWILGLVGGAAVIGGGLFWYEKLRGVSVTVNPLVNNVTVPTGQKLTVNLPAGSSWVGSINLNGTGVTGTVSGGTGTSPLVISNVTGGGTIALAWSDVTGAPQAGTLSVTVS
jgi:hypothetical protein